MHEIGFNTSNTREKARGAALEVGTDFRLHPLIHTLLEFNLAQDIGSFQGMGS